MDISINIELNSLCANIFGKGINSTVLPPVVKLVTLVEGDPKAPFSIATKQKCKEGHCSIPWIAPLYP